jgi:hypothetical protein
MEFISAKRLIRIIAQLKKDGKDTSKYDKILDDLKSRGF